MVMYDKINIEKQKEILSKLIDVNSEISDEFEAQKIIYNKMCEYINEYDFKNLSINVFVNDDSKKKWKSSSKVENEFIKIYFNEIKHAAKTYDITKAELMFLYSLGDYLLWESNLLIDSEGKPLNQKALMKELGLGRTSISNNVKSLERKKCLIRIWDGRDVYFLINPYLMIKGQRINKEIPNLFEIIGYEPMSKINKNKKK